MADFEKASKGMPKSFAAFLRCECRSCHGVCDRSELTAHECFDAFRECMNRSYCNEEDFNFPYPCRIFELCVGAGERDVL